MASNEYEERLLAAAQQDASNAAVDQTQGDQIRILQCFECKTMEEVPDFQGHPDDDVFLHYADEKHGGQTENPHWRALHRVLAASWSNPKMRKPMVEQMWANETGFKPSYYDIKNNFQQDAATCFKAHHRSIPCLDYRDQSKLLPSPTRRDRQALARELPRSANVDRASLARGGPKVYLCSFCPVQVTVDAAKRKARGEA